MGLFCANLHFRTTDDSALSAALSRQGIDKFRVLPARTGWTSLYEEQASQQDDDRIRALGGDLSKDLGVAAIAFMVHDSDVACYWLFDNGQLLDEFNSCPGYFDDDDGESPGPSGGRPDVLVRFCRPGVGQDEVAAILSEDAVFAERVIERLAAALGIDRQRALADYREDGGGDPASGDDESSNEDDDRGSAATSPRNRLLGRLAGMLGLGAKGAATDPQAQALVTAAARDDVEEIIRLLAAGVPIDAEAPAPLNVEQPTSGLARLLPTGPPQFAMTPLLAAVVNKKARAAEKLLESGADPNRGNPIFGAAVHAAAGAGETSLLGLIIDRGGDVNAPNSRGQSPLQVIATGRASKERLAQAQAMMKSMGAKLPGLAEQLSSVVLPIEGWDACERLLKERGAR